MKYDALHEQLEKEGRFDQYTVPFNTSNTVKVDKSYIYLDKKWYKKLLRGFDIAVMAALGPLLNKIWYGLKTEGRENKKMLKKSGAVTISNHVLTLDSLIIKQTFGFARTYMTGAKHNNKRGLGGDILRAGGFLPLNGDFAAYKNLIAASSYLLKNGKFVHFNPEQAMWIGYEKPRPFKPGAFKFAVNNNVPVLPMIILFGRPKGLRKLLHMPRPVTVKILKPLYPDLTLDKHLRSIDLLKRAQDEYKTAYEEYYKKPLTYLCGDISPFYANSGELSAEKKPAVFCAEEEAEFRAADIN